jgi:hypothetical protein
MEYLGLHNKPKAEHPERLLTALKKKRRRKKKNTKY